MEFSIGEFYLTFKEELTLIFLKVFQNIQEKTCCPSLFYEVSITLFWNPGNYATEKEDYRPITLMNIDATILNKILANWTQEYIKNIYHSPWSSGICSGMKGWHRNCKSINMIYHIYKMKNRNHMIISNTVPIYFQTKWK